MSTEESNLSWAHRKAATVHPAHLTMVCIAAIWCMASWFSGGGAIDLIVVLALEALFQTYAPDHAFFREPIDQAAEADRLAKAQWARRHALDGVGSVVCERYKEILQVEDTIRNHLDSQPDEVRIAMADVVTRASNLVRTYVRLAKYQKGMLDFIRGSDTKNLEDVLGQLQTRQSDEKVPTKIRELEIRRIQILQTRLGHVQTVRDQQPMVEAQIESVVDALLLLRDRVTSFAVGGVRFNAEDVLNDTSYDTGAEEVLTAFQEAADLDEDHRVLKETLQGTSRR